MPLRKLFLGVFWASIAVTLTAQVWTDMPSLERNHHNFSLFAPENSSVSVRLYVDGELVAENAGYLRDLGGHTREAYPPNGEPGEMYTIIEIRRALTFPFEEGAAGTRTVTIEGELWLPDAKKSIPVSGESVIEYFRDVYDSEIFLWINGTAEFRVAFG